MAVNFFFIVSLRFRNDLHAFKINSSDILFHLYPCERYEPPYPPSYELNNTTTYLLGEWLWH